jgi:hypothetical protein
VFISFSSFLTINARNFESGNIVGGHRVRHRGTIIPGPYLKSFFSTFYIPVLYYYMGAVMEGRVYCGEIRPFFLKATRS